MNKTILGITTAAVLLGFSALAAASGPAFGTVLQPYEKVRQRLVADDLAGVRGPARELAAAIDRLSGDLSAEEAGVPADKLADVKALLPALDQAASKLAAAEDLGAARDAFYALSKPLVRWRQAAGEGPAVVYCSMKKRSWLQSAEDDIGNPYYGQAMAGCGEVVSK